MTLTVDDDAQNDRKTEALMGNRKVRILLVDDDEDDYVLTRELLTDIPDGYFELDWAPEPEAALQTMLHNQHDLCLIDYHLGCTNGLTLLREAMNLGSKMPMILLTGQGERAVDVGAMQAGAVDFLEKGRLDCALLERSIRYALQGKKHADELERKVKERTEELALANQALQAEIAERMRAEDALRATDRRKDEFLSTLAHELRNPLVPIRNALEIMRLSDNAPAVVESSRAMIERQVKLMVRLIDDLLDVARISRGTIKLKRETTEVARVVASAVESSRPVVDRAGHRLTVNVPAEPIVLDADPTRLAQVLLNLLDNAAKYTEPQGSIWLSAARDGGELVFRVKDTGLGIAADMLPRIFEIFTQVGRSSDGTQHGLGIGLSLVKTLVQLHGGSVKATSAGPGHGSEFVVRLPLPEPISN
jgi:signal transduction histidine kinase